MPKTFEQLKVQGRADVMPKTFEQLKKEFDIALKNQSAAGDTSGKLFVSIIVGSLIIVFISKYLGWFDSINFSQYPSEVINSLYLIFLLLVISLAGFFILKGASSGVGIVHIAGEIDEVAKKKFRVKKLERYPFVELTMRGNSKNTLAAVKQIFEKLKLSKVKLDESKRMVTGLNDFAPRGLAGFTKPGLARIGGVISRQRVSATVTKSVQKTSVLRISAKGPYMGLDYFMLESIERGLRSSRKLKVLRATKPAGGRSDFF